MNSKSPEIRFNGFTDDWEQRKLEEVFNQTVEYVDPKESNLQLWSVTVEKGLTPKTKRYNREALVKKTDKFKVVHPGNIVYNPMNMTIGSVGFNNNSKSVAVSGYYVTMSMNEGFSNNYFSNWLPSQRAIQLYKMYATGSLIEKQRVQFPTLSSIKTHLPSFKEQEKIGNFLNKLNETIALHQRELDNLIKSKKGFLQKMFPKKDEKTPEIRFNEFTGDWQEHKLGELSPLRGGFAFKSSEFSDNGVPIVRISNILSSGIVGGDYAYYNVQDKDDNYLLPDRAAVLAMSGATTGKVSILENPYNRKVYQNQRVGYFVKTINADYEFISTLVRSKLFTDQLASVLVAGAQPNVSSKDIDGFKFMVPSDIQEQHKIGKFFKQIDDTIVLHQHQLDKLKQTKKAFLQKMFV
ncbi:restriction endonuclease subunit S [Marinilactibacillus psychrotolerans]|uniref:restriction endonuclease subunit S n=1 Tax=Marinilactibacillus psychrotolerans TaxID=191770 RepID=UPI00388496EA